MSAVAHAPAVEFLHYGDTGNVGDLLCSPRHYFDFASDRPALIVGGGASNNFFCGRAWKRSAGVRIAWAIGQSWRPGREASPWDRLLKSATRRLTYARASTRDPALVSDQLPLVPCVSVLHPVTEMPAGTEVGIFLNANAHVSGEHEAMRLRLPCAALFGPRAFMATNGLSADAFMRSFRRTGTVITNSYHAAYWGLLSGRSVHIIGYSSKFSSLAALFDFPESAVIRVSRGDGDALIRAIKQCADRAPLRLAKPGLVRSDFRKRNLDFAQSLGAVGLFATLKAANDDARFSASMARQDALA